MKNTDTDSSTIDTSDSDVPLKDIQKKLRFKKPKQTTTSLSSDDVPLAKLRKQWAHTQTDYYSVNPYSTDDTSDSNLPLHKLKKRMLRKGKKQIQVVNNHCHFPLSL